MIEPLILIEFIIAIALLAFFHELGHFVFARLVGVEVEEFGMGLPPRWFKLFTWKGTEFTVNKIPFGAFVRPKGENDPDVPGGLAAANPWKRFIVMVGGPLMNLVIGLLVFIIVFMVNGMTDFINVQIKEVVEKSPAAQAGFMPGDLVIRMEDELNPSSSTIRSLVSQNPGKGISFNLERDGKVIKTTVIPQINPQDGLAYIGIRMDGTQVSSPIPVNQAVSLGFTEMGMLTKNIITLPAKLIEGVIAPDQARVVSIVGMYQMYQQVNDMQAQAGTQNPQAPKFEVLHFLGLISVALGLTNLLPLPALDGGRIIFLFPEIIFRKRVPQRFENAVHGIGLSALLLLMMVLVVNDLINPINLH